MDFRVTELSELPRLAWLASVNPLSRATRVFCGQSVEHGDTYAIEGCWSDHFDPSRLLTSQVVTGTGLVCHNGQVGLATASDTTQPLYEFRSADAVLYSNSLCFLLEFADLDLQAGYPYYDTDSMSIFLGLRRYRRRIPTAQGAVHVHYHCQIEISENLSPLFD
jgi:hypothetical protein